MANLNRRNMLLGLGAAGALVKGAGETMAEAANVFPSGGNAPSVGPSLVGYATSSPPPRPGTIEFLEWQFRRGEERECSGMYYPTPGNRHWSNFTIEERRAFWRAKVHKRFHLPAAVKSKGLLVPVPKTLQNELDDLRDILGEALRAANRSERIPLKSGE